MVPHLGQGANQTIEDAAVLADCLTAASDVPSAITRYERLRRTRTRQIQRASLVTSPWMHLHDGQALRRDRDDLPAVADRQAWIHGYDARTALASA